MYEGVKYVKELMMNIQEERENSCEGSECIQNVVVAGAVSKLVKLQINKDSLENLWELFKDEKYV